MIEKKAIVTGGKGFIGSHIVDRLVNENYQVLVIDDESANTHESFYYNKEATYYKESVQNYDKIVSLFRDVDIVFHLAAEARIQPCIHNPLMAATANVLGTCSVLQASKVNNVRRVIYSSTSSAYAKNATPFSEDSKTHCLNPYSVSKVAGEEFCRIYYELYDLETITFRYFNVYGERQPLKGQYAPVIGLFQEQFKRGEPMTIVGNGRQTRDFTHVSDVVEANMLAATTDNKEAFGEVFNIGTGKRYSINEITKMIGGPSPDVTFIPPRPGEALNTEANYSKAKTILGWEPKKQLPNWIYGVPDNFRFEGL